MNRWALLAIFISTCCDILFGDQTTRYKFNSDTEDESNKESKTLWVNALVNSRPSSSYGRGGGGGGSLPWWGIFLLVVTVLALLCICGLYCKFAHPDSNGESSDNEREAEKAANRSTSKLLQTRRISKSMNAIL
uniref:Uncharacterized protein n=1 Tax=Romanomermis culicivorax TaxID=13658 RepID=A0A915JIX8_ROMCU